MGGTFSVVSGFVSLVSALDACRRLLLRRLYRHTRNPRIASRHNPTTEHTTAIPAAAPALSPEFFKSLSLTPVVKVIVAVGVVVVDEERTRDAGDADSFDEVVKDELVFLFGILVALADAALLSILDDAGTEGVDEALLIALESDPCRAAELALPAEPATTLLDRLI